MLVGRTKKGHLQGVGMDGVLEICEEQQEEDGGLEGHF